MKPTPADKETAEESKSAKGKRTMKRNHALLGRFSGDDGTQLQHMNAMKMIYLCLFLVSLAGVCGAEDSPRRAASRIEFELISEWPPTNASAGTYGNVFDENGRPVQSDAYSGHPADILVTNGIAYLAMRGLQIVDVKDPTHPKGLSRHRIIGLAQSVALQGVHAFVVDDYCPDGPSSPDAEGQIGLQVFDIRDSLKPVKLNKKSFFGHSHSRRVWVRGNMAYLLHGPIQRVDVSNPAEPKLISPSAHLPSIDGTGCMDRNSFYYVRNYVFEAPHLVILNLDNSETMEQVGGFPVPGESYKGKQLDALVAYGAVEVSGGYAYLGGSGVLTVLDVRDRTKPRLVSVTATRTGMHPTRSSLQGDTLLIADEYYGILV